MHDAVEVDDVHVAGEELEDRGHIDWRRRFRGEVGRAAGGKIAAETLLLHRLVLHGRVVKTQD